jgi:hypothetical protein
MFLDLWIYDFCVPTGKLERRLSNALLICCFRAILQGLHRKRRRQSNCQRHSVQTVNVKKQAWH